MYATEEDLVARFGDEIENLKAMLPSQSSITDAIQDATERSYRWSLSFATSQCA